MMDSLKREISSLPEFTITPRFEGISHDIDPRTGLLVVRARARVTINGVNRKTVCCVGIDEETRANAGDGKHDKTSEQLLAECETAARESVTAIDRRSCFVEMGASASVKSLGDMGIAPPKLKDVA